MVLKPKAPKSRYELVAGNILELLTDKVAYEGWSNGLARKKCFYIRGITWFTSAVLGSELTIAQCKQFIQLRRRARSSFWCLRQFGFGQLLATTGPRTRVVPLGSRC
jgi:hypothetical protein